MIETLELRDGERLTVELETEAAAGITLGDGRRWWGTRAKYREPGSRRWSSVTLVDVHPFALEELRIALGLAIAKLREGRSS